MITLDEPQILAYLSQDAAALAAAEEAPWQHLALQAIRYKKWQVLRYLLEQGYILLEDIQDAICANRKHTRSYKSEFTAIVESYLLIQQRVIDKHRLFTLAMMSDSAQVLAIISRDKAFLDALNPQDLDLSTMQVAASVWLMQQRPDLIEPIVSAYCDRYGSSACAVDPALMDALCLPMYRAYLTPPLIARILDYMAHRWRAYPVNVRSAVLGAFVEDISFEQARTLYKAGAKTLQGDPCVLEVIYRKFASDLRLWDVNLFFKEADIMQGSLSDAMCQVLCAVAMRQLGNIVYEKISAPHEERKYRKGYPHLIDHAAFQLACKEPRLQRPFVIWAARNGELHQFEALIATGSLALASEALHETILASKRENCAGPLESRLKLMHRILERVPNLHEQLSRVVMNQCLKVALEVKNADILRALHAHFFVYQGNARIAEQIQEVLERTMESCTEVVF